MRKSTEILDAFSPQDALEGRDAFFLVGIGGAGMSALARMLAHRGHRVIGTDLSESPETAKLREEGFPVRIGHVAEGLTERHALIVSDAIDLEESPEVAEARQLGCPIVRRSQALGWLLKSRRVVAVTGTHGKTTTTGLISAGLRAAGLDPLIVVGAQVPTFGSPVVEGEGETAVVEACEAYESYRDLDPFIAVLTNLELDHVDFHGDFATLKASVARFVARLPEEGCLVYCQEDPGAKEIAEGFSGRKVPYGVDFPGPIALPGRHNLLNASAARAVARELGADLARAEEGIREFTGAERRLQVLEDGPIAVVDDYAHHPSEIRASLSALRERYPNRRLVVAYQPHLYSRTQGLIPEFAEALSLADVVALTDIYPAREAPLPGVSSARIAERIEGEVLYVPSRHLLPREIARLARPGDVVVGMGAGTISEFAPGFIEELRRAERADKPRIFVAYGGDNAEREVSLHSGRAVFAALGRLGYPAELGDVTELLLGQGSLARFTGPNRPDLVFLAVHGPNAEDGGIQGMLELLHMPYTGSGVLASALAMDKRRAKEALARAGIRVPQGGYFESIEALAAHPEPWRYPLVVKPNAQGSTVGLSFVDREEELLPALRRALRYDRGALVEERLEGMEISVPTLGERALPVIEIVPQSGRYDFAAKYLPGATEEIVPARLPEPLLREAERLAVASHRALGCEGASRTDMIVSGETISVLEVNTLPGLTGTSLLPNSAQAAGLSFDALVEWIVRDALKRRSAQGASTP